jgi:hypothetical protein
MSEVVRLVMATWFLSATVSCGAPTPAISMPSRHTSIPDGASKVGPGSDLYPPLSLTDEYFDPVPLPFPVNTAGAEDSAFIVPDGETLYVWFTPDPPIPAERQLGDGVTGIYVSQTVGGVWTDPARVVLEEPGTLALDGCEFILDETMWFCTTREGFARIHWFTAKWIGGVWTGWKLAGFPPDYQVGELHITSDGRELYFHSSRPGGHGDYDIWVSSNAGGKWQAPVNVDAINSSSSDGWPFVSPDGSQLWFTRSVGAPSLWRSIRNPDGWSAPEEMFSPFAAEASQDAHGNVFFTHHFYRDDQMLEADIYFASPKTE